MESRAVDLTNLTLKRDWKKAFLDSLSKSPNVTKAAKAAQFTRQRMYQLRDEDPDFAAEWDSALQEAMDNAEGETYRRAVKGTLKPVFHKGEEVGKIREYSDTLLMFWLKAHRPEIYKETVRNEMTGKNGEPLPPPTAVNPVVIYIPSNGRDIKNNEVSED